jgi:hypothetical protein
LARKGAKSRRSITRLRSKTAKARPHVDRLRAANADPKKKLVEALEQQTATAEVLQVISSSPGELRPVFQSMLANAVRICEAKIGTLYLREGDGFRTVAVHNAPPAYVEARTRELIRPPPDSTLGRVAATKQVVHIADIKTIPSYVERNPFVVTPVELGGYRTVLAVPMLKDDELIGAITINRQEVRPFTDKQIDLLKKTATADVLKVISGSPGELEPVFQAMLEMRCGYAPPALATCICVTASFFASPPFTTPRRLSSRAAGSGPTVRVRIRRQADWCGRGLSFMSPTSWSTRRISRAIREWWRSPSSPAPEPLSWSRCSRRAS